MKVNIKKLPKLLKRTLNAGISSFIWGAPGLGKSDVVKQLAADNNLELIDIRLSQIDPLDMTGLPSVNNEKTKARYLPMDMFPLEGDPLPQGKNGFLIFLDEANQAPRSVQAAAFQLTLDKAVGQNKLHPMTAIVLAGNNDTDGGITVKISTPMMSRLAHFELIIDSEAWIEWAHNNDIDYRIISFINFRPDLLNKFNPKTQDKTFSCPRTWEFASKLIIEQASLDHDDTVLLASVLSEGVSREFVSYTQNFSKLANIKEIIANPGKVEVPSEPASRYAYTGLISNHIDNNNAIPLLKFISRFPVEFSIITMIPAIKKNPSLNNNPAVVEWRVQNLHSIL